MFLYVHIVILVVNLFVDEFGVTTMMWVSFSDMKSSCITDTHFVFILFFTLRFSAQAVVLKHLENPKETWILPSQWTRINYVDFQHSLGHLLSYTSYKSWDSVLPFFLHNHDLQRPSGFYNLCTWWVVLLPSQADWDPWGSSCLAPEQNKTNEPMKYPWTQVILPCWKLKCRFTET